MVWGGKEVPIAYGSGSGEIMRILRIQIRILNTDGYLNIYQEKSEQLPTWAPVKVPTHSRPTTNYNKNNRSIPFSYESDIK